MKKTSIEYGFYSGGDPRRFSPDRECCTEQELANHAAACALWDEAEKRGQTPPPEKNPSGWLLDESGKPYMHVLRAPYGIGIYEIELDDEFDAHDADTAAA